MSTPSIPEAVLDRLFGRVQQVECVGFEFPCLVWTGCTAESGHGVIRVGSKTVFVHRLMWALTNHEEMPDECLVRHLCDNPPCCEPTHLELGTHEDNVNDRVRRGRSAYGERNGRSKLTAVDAVAIRSRCDEPVSVLAREYHVDPRAIRAILAGETWRTA